MKAVVFLACLAIAVSALEFQTIPSGSPFGTPLQFPVFESVLADYAKFQSAIKQAVEAKAQPLQGAMTTQAVSVGCQTAVDALAGVYVSGSCQTLPDFTAATQDTMTAFCTSDCITKIKAKVDAIGTACTGADASIYVDSTFATKLRTASGQIEMLCTQDGGKYCLVALQKWGTVLKSGVTAEALTEICTPCSVKIIIAAAQYGERPAQAAALYLDMLCMKRDGVFCAPQLATLSQQMQLAQQTQDFSAICHPCVSAMMAKMIEVSSTFTDDVTTKAQAQAYVSVGKVLRVYCQKSGGEFCINIIFRASSSLEAGGNPGCPEDPTAASPCPDSCKGFVVTLRNSMGCCLSGFLSMINGQGDSKTDITGFINTACGVSIGGSCSSQVIKATFRITNLRFGYYLANKALVEEKLRSDLALFAGVSAADVTLESVSEVTASGKGMQLFAGAGINVKYTVVPTDEGQAAEIKANILAGAAVALPSVSTLPLDARESPTQAVGVDTSHSAAESVEVGAASTVQASFAAVILAAFAFFAARQ
jgi:hypothetical protein